MLQIPSDFKYSKSWFANFKNRYGLVNKKAHGQSGVVDKKRWSLKELD